MNAAYSASAGRGEPCGGMARTLSFVRTLSQVPAWPSRSSNFAASRFTGASDGNRVRLLWHETQYLSTNARYLTASAGAGRATLDFTGTSTIVARHIFGTGQDALIARIASATTTWYGQDILGSTRDLFNSAGSLIDHLDYNTFGKKTYESASGSDRYLWTAREYDAEVLTAHPRVGDFFESVLRARPGDRGWAKRAANFMMTEILAEVRTHGLTATFPLGAEQLVEMIQNLLRAPHCESGHQEPEFLLQSDADDPAKFRQGFLHRFVITITIGRFEEDHVGPYKR